MPDASEQEIDEATRHWFAYLELLDQLANEKRPADSHSDDRYVSCRGREPGYPGPPAQVPACGFPAPGSCRRSDAIEGRGLGGPCMLRSVGE
jgi:hypothetical protein